MVWRIALYIVVVIEMLPDHLSAQDAGGSAGAAAHRHVVETHSTGDVELGRSVEGRVRDTLDGAWLGGARQMVTIMAALAPIVRRAGQAAWADELAHFVVSSIQPGSTHTARTPSGCWAGPGLGRRRSRRWRWSRRSR